ncbi:hypothetical protein KR018_005100 [Drosophila ironensis]|nr:hypothetical protein KR018_005100 [Drosophila ironensis]
MPRKARKAAESEDLQSLLSNIQDEIEGASDDKVMDKLLEAIEEEDHVKAPKNKVDEEEEEDEEAEAEEEEFDEDKYFIDDEGNCYIKTTPKVQKELEKKLKDAQAKKSKPKEPPKSSSKPINLRPASSPQKGSSPHKAQAQPKAISVRPARAAAAKPAAPAPQPPPKPATRGRPRKHKPEEPKQAAAAEEEEEFVDDPVSSDVVSNLADYSVDSGEAEGVEVLEAQNPDEAYEVFEFDEKAAAAAAEQEVGFALSGRALSLKPAPAEAKGESGSGSNYSCSKCAYQTNKKFLITRHCRIHDEDPSFKCSICERTFRSKVGLVNHMNTHSGVKPHKCKFCESAFTTSGELIRHTRYKHTKEKPHKCTECSYASVELTKLRRHMTCHTGERPYQCPHCTYASQDMFKLKRHMVIHTGEKKYQCDICKSRFTQSNSLKSHKLIHTVVDKPAYQCTYCPTTCGRKADLRIHIKHMHTADKPITCRRCGQQLPDRYQYKLHIKSHEGEKCYSCTLCPYASVTKRHLDSHMLIHLDEKPFKCDQCPLTFRQRQLLRRHVNLAHNEQYEPPQPREKVHKCPSCSRVFTHKGNLMRHMELHDNTVNAREQRQRLKMGRNLRIQADGTLINLENEKQFIKLNENGEEELYDLAEIEEEEEELEEQEDVAPEEPVFASPLAPKPQPVIINKQARQPATGKQKPVIINRRLRSQAGAKTFHIKEEPDNSDFTVELQGEDGELMVVELVNGAEEVLVKQEPSAGKKISATNCFGFEEDEDFEEFVEQDNEAETTSQEFLQLMDMIEQDG